MTTSARAAIVENAGSEFSIDTVDLDQIQDDEVLVKIRAAGLCHTDLSALAGHTGHVFPAVFGHEAAGIVEAVGRNASGLQEGDHVALSFTSCGECKHCWSGHPAYCTTWVPRNLLNGGVRADGTATITRSGESVTGRFFGQSSFAEYAIVDRRSVVKVDASLPPEIAAPLGCGIQTGAGAVLNVLHPSPGATLAVFGTGAVGLSAIMAAALLPLARIIAVDVVPSRLELARELGATDVVDASSADVSVALSELTHGAGLDFAVDTTANSMVTRTITDNLGTFGKLAVVGAPPLGTELTVDISAFLIGRSVVGVTEGDSNPEVFIPTLVDLYRQGRFPVDRLVSKYSFEDINQAVADATSGAAIKPVLIINE